jgi:hypothetical protein
MYLNTEDNNVYINHIYGEKEDTLEIMDYGVGLGGKRLEGFFDIGFSTKRNTTGNLGGFGYGSKVPFSLRGEHFDLETAHNGRLFKFRIYPYKFESLISKFNDDETTNRNIYFKGNDENPIPIYYNTTLSANYVKIIIPIKSYRREKIKLAVKRQLLYYNNVIFNIVHDENYTEYVNFKADVLYNSDNITISNQYIYNKPHVLIVKDKLSSNGICYGFINFEELETENLGGAVGFKCPMRQVIEDENGNEVVIVEGVDVTNSRESVIWNSNTRNYLLNIVKNVKEEAKEIIKKEINEEDFIKFLIKYNSLVNYNNNSVLSNLKQLIDIKDINTQYKGMNIYNNINLTFRGYNIFYFKVEYDWKKSNNKLNKFNLLNYTRFTEDTTYIYKDPDTKLNHRKNTYLQKLYGEKCIIFNNIGEKFIIDSYKNKEVDIESYIDDHNYITNQILNSKFIVNYNDVIIPDNFVCNNDDDEEYLLDENGNYKLDENGQLLYKVNEYTPVPTLSPAEERRLKGEVFYRTPYINDRWGTQTNYTFCNNNSDKLENLYNRENLHYSYKEDDFYTYLALNLKIPIIQISKSFDSKFQKEKNHIKLALGINYKNNEIIMNDKLIKYYTCEIIEKYIDKISFLESFESYNKNYFDLFKEVSTYYNENSRTFRGSYKNKEEDLKEFNNYLEKVFDFQLYLRDNKDNSESIKNKSLELFSNDNINNANCVDIDIYDKLMQLVTYCQGLELFINLNINSTDPGLILEYLQFKQK